MAVSPKGKFADTVTPEGKFIDTKVIVETKITDKIDGYDDDECMENFILKINCGICETPVITNTIDRNYYCLDGCPMEKIEEIQKQYDLKWIKEHGNNTITNTKDNNNGNNQNCCVSELELATSTVPDNNLERDDSESS